MLKGIHPEGLQAIEIDLLNIERGGLDDHLILIIVLKPIRILTISAIGRTARRFNISYPPGFGAQDSEESSGMESASPNF
jgi:hypothetical protein